MKLTRIELHWVRLPLVAPFQTSFGVEYDREALLVKAVTPDVVGWGECVALPQPLYSAEYVDGAADALIRFLVPAVSALPDVTAAAVGDALTAVKGHPMAKAALEIAILDAQLRQANMPLADYLGAVRPAVPSGVSVGIMASIPQLLDAVDGYLAAGYQRIKLKIQPGWDVAPVRAVREHIGDAVPLQVDANGAYTLADAVHLAKLDPFELLMIEQPLVEDDLRGHAALARRLRTPICLDESVTSPARAVEAIESGAAAVINIKPGRVGGYLQARRIHDICAAHGVPVWVGGMLETGIGRAANLALAALPNFSLVGDVSASDRFFARDITPPITMRDGWIEVPTGPGIGVEPDDAALKEASVRSEWIDL
ncbi:o-succinylbenzoate synthase [Micromonospora sp. NPDC048830]|uniref:o-succinylbenzoate synthase n=1 Tax=Micromonospora sp. NPDC048830 TaxID=3364257 RepID=UPI003713FA9D